MQILQAIFSNNNWDKPLPYEWDDPKTLVLVFSYDPACIDFLQKKFSQSSIVGCSSGGDIYGDHHFEYSTSVSFIKFSSTHLKMFSCDLDFNGSFEAGRSVTQALITESGIKPHAIMLFTPGLLKINGARFADGLTQNMDMSTKIFGGVAGDPKITSTWTIDSKGIQLHKVIAIGLYGPDIICELTTQSGASPLGIERTITRAKGNVVYEVDNKPAIDFYQQYLGYDIADITKTLQFPLALTKSFKIDNGPLRTPQFVDIEHKSVTFTEAIPEGSKVRIMMVSRENIVLGAGKASAMLKNLADPHMHQKDGDIFLLPISCIGRKFILGESIEDEVESIAEFFDRKTIHMHGFYSFGEFASSQQTGTCELHNQTLNLAMLMEKKVA